MKKDDIIAANEPSNDTISANESSRIDASAPISLPVEVQLVQCQKEILDRVNKFLSSNSAILLSGFLNNIAEDVNKIAESQTRDILKNMGYKVE